jgi:hypothetical protein
MARAVMQAKSTDIFFMKTSLNAIDGEMVIETTSVRRNVIPLKHPIGHRMQSVTTMWDIVAQTLHYPQLARFVNDAEGRVLGERLPLQMRRNGV